MFRTKTPLSDGGIRKYDNLTPEKAIILSWVEAGRMPGFHKKQQQYFRDRMPLLVRAIERLVEENK